MSTRRYRSPGTSRALQYFFLSSIVALTSACNAFSNEQYCNPIENTPKQISLPFSIFLHSEEAPRGGAWKLEISAYDSKGRLIDKDKTFISKTQKSYKVSRNHVNSQEDEFPDTPGLFADLNFLENNQERIIQGEIGYTYTIGNMITDTVKTTTKNGDSKSRNFSDWFTHEEKEVLHSGCDRDRKVVMSQTFTVKETVLGKAATKRLIGTFPPSSR